jgi:transcriptional regulator with XRE-family HTH domain
MGKKAGIRVAPDRIESVKLAVDRLFHRQQDLADKVGIARSTVQAFLRGDRVSRLNFEEICVALHLDWEAIAEKPQPSAITETDERPTADIEALVEKISQQLYEKIQNLYGQIKPLDISQPINIENLCINVNIVVSSNQVASE